MDNTNQQQQLATTSQIPTMMDGQVINGIRGTLTRIYERKAGTNSTGDWSIQNGEVTDDTGSIPITIHGKPEIAQGMKGRQVTFMSVQTQNGVHGVKVFDDTYKGKTTRKLKITGSCDIQAKDFAQAQQPAQQPQHGDANYDPPFDEPTQPQQPQKPATNTAQPQQQPQPQQNAANSTKPQPALPAGAVVRSITYREVRQKREYEPVTFELTIDLPEGGKISDAWKYAEAAGDACLRHSTGK